MVASERPVMPARSMVGPAVTAATRAPRVPVALVAVPAAAGRMVRPGRPGRRRPPVVTVVPAVSVSPRASWALTAARVASVVMPERSVMAVRVVPAAAV
jgi:hypothetical protein